MNQAVQDFVIQAQTHLQEQLKNSPVLGAPFESRGKTLISVSKAPSWLNRFKNGEWASGKPLGFLEISDHKTRFVAVKDQRWLLLGLGLALIGLIVFLASLGLQKKRGGKHKHSLW